MGLISICVDCFKLFMLTAQKPAQRFCILLRCDMLGGVGWGGGCNIVLCLRYHRFSSVNTLHIASCYIAHFCCISVNTLHVTLQSSVVLRWNTLHVMLHTSVVLRWTHFMLCCTLLLHIGEHTSCYVAHFCCTSVNACEHTTCYVATLLLYFGEHILCYVVHVWVCAPLRRQFTKIARCVQRGNLKVLVVH